MCGGGRGEGRMKTGCEMKSLANTTHACKLDIATYQPLSEATCYN